MRTAITVLDVFAAGVGRNSVGGVGTILPPAGPGWRLKRVHWSISAQGLTALGANVGSPFRPSWALQLGGNVPAIAPDVSVGLEGTTWVTQGPATFVVPNLSDPAVAMFDVSCIVTAEWFIDE